ncbi:hypothetical protein [Flavobacterium reichenbachii]|uniref:DUF4760 domain-containing protein n=1 Tax=Flavobacterium reichenbachii TaxID=362418 RepID=A0A085ZNT9_9FLAO|nr:hypothetical protein [Flavobacterium reichenbachii]KFF06103.1 hypothetical protein IW19_11440 [Flavobacterium reichenbachii]OXB14673.1 hypothetical protein B0A68_11505 [Flavobacterium reichenbachii]
MTSNEITFFFTNNKDTLTILISSFVGLLTFCTLLKAIIEYRLQGRQKRAELFDKFKTTLMTENRIITINSYLEDDDINLINIPLIDRYYFLGYYEQIAIAVNSGLIKKDVAHYMFGYFAICCWKSDNFWAGINKESYYWSIFKKYVDNMQSLEDRNINKSNLKKMLDNLTGRSNFKY